MDYFNYKDNQLYVEDVPVASLAREFCTPAYIYSRATIERHWHAFNDAFGDQSHLICYAVKANSNVAILNLLARLGSGFDIVSVGELERVLAAKGDPAKIVFSGVGKKSAEIKRALDVGIRCFNIESEAELLRVNHVARDMGKIAPISIRVNPDVDAQTHPYISTGLRDNKFGIAYEEAERVYQQAAELTHVNVQGIDCHIGSQLTELAPFSDALERVLVLAERLKKQGVAIKHLDIGGGLGVRYNDETPPLPADYTKQLFLQEKIREYEIIIEPGRAIAANAGILLTEVEFLKHTDHKNFAIVDAAMNDLIRPALYQSWQNIIPVIKPCSTQKLEVYDIVGPVCETGDFLGKSREMRLKEGDLLAVRSSGAYGFTMASNYNSRPRAVELLVDGDQVHVIRQRESFADLIRGESLLPE
jgi:diaminopimelate decarboxylase